MPHHWPVLQDFGPHWLANEYIYVLSKMCEGMYVCSLEFSILALVQGLLLTLHSAITPGMLGDQICVGCMQDQCPPLERKIWNEDTGCIMSESIHLPGD